MPGPEQMSDVPHALAGQKGEEFRRHLDEFSAKRMSCRYPLPSELAVFRGIRTKREQVGGRELGHLGTSSCGGAGRFMVGRVPGRVTACMAATVRGTWMTNTGTCQVHQVRMTADERFRGRHQSSANR